MGLLIAFAIFGCKIDADCVVIEAACPGWEIVNKARAADRRKFNAEVSADIGCRSPDAGPRPEPACVSRACVHKLPAAPDPGACARAAAWLEELRLYAASDKKDKAAALRVRAARKRLETRCPS